MPNALAVLDRQFLEMRARCLSLAADVDRVQRGEDGAMLLSDDRMVQLREALRIVMGPEARRAERVEMLFSDQTPAPSIDSK